MLILVLVKMEKAYTFQVMYLIVVSRLERVHLGRLMKH
jgi:hypothetical protein